MYQKRSSFCSGVSGIAVAGLLSVASSRAALIAYEGFDYAVGTLAGQSGGTGWGGSWSAGTVVANSLSYGTLATTGNSAVISGASGSVSAYRDLLGLQTTGTYYVSFLAQRLQPHGTLDDNTMRATSFQLLTGTGTTGGGERVSAGKVTTADPNQTYNWSLFSDAGSAGIDQTTEPIINLAFIVMEVTIADATDGNDSDTARMWLNPSLTGPLGTPDAEMTGVADYLFQRIRVFAGGNATQGPYGEIAIDEIRIGTELIDVVPEPSSALLGGLGVLGLLRRRRA